MSQPTQSHSSQVDAPPSAAARGLIVFAGVLMIMAGAFQTFAGVVALFQDEFFVATRNYVLQFDATSWGWIHLLIGLLVLCSAVRPDLGPRRRHHPGCPQRAV